MSSVIVGTAGHIDHGKTALIKALNGYEGDETIEEQKRGITIDLSFSNLKIGQKNIAFIDVPGHEKLVKNMIAGAFGFNAVMLVIAADDGIMPQTREHVEIISLLEVKDLIVVITKRDLVENSELKELEEEIDTYLGGYDFDYVKQTVSIYEPSSVEKLKELLFTIDLKQKPEENFFRYYVDRVFSPKGIGTVVTGTVLGKGIELDEKVFVCELQKEVRLKNIQVHGENTPSAVASNRAALNLSNVDHKKVKKGFLISKKGFLRGFDTIDIFFKSLKEKELIHNRDYIVFIGSKRVSGRVLLFDETNKERGFAKLKLEEEVFSVYNEKLILREENQTIAGAKVLNPINDPMKKSQKREYLEALEKRNLQDAFKTLLDAHKKGFGLISSYQRFAKNHEEVLKIAHSIEGVFVDEKSLVVYPKEVKKEIEAQIVSIFSKNRYALLSPASLHLRIKWASEALIESVLDALVQRKDLEKDNNLYRNIDVAKDLDEILQLRILERLKEEEFSPTAPYNIYDELFLDRKIGDGILKKLTGNKSVVRLQHNLFIESSNLGKVVEMIRDIIKEEGYVDIKLFKERLTLSRKYLVAYLDYIDNFDDIKKEGNRRYFNGTI